MKGPLSAVHRTLASAFLALVLTLGTAIPAIASEKDQRSQQPRGYAYLGVFYVTNINTHLNVFSQDIPLGARFDVSEQFGFRDSLTVPRVSIGWRFKKNHVLGFTWYDLERDGSKVLFEDMDWLLVNYDEYRGRLLDMQLFASHHTFKHVGFGAGLNAQMVSLDVDDEELYWEIDTDFLGLLFVVSFYF